MNKRGVFAMGLALAVGGAGAMFAFDAPVAGEPPTLALLSPPGAGYDSTNISLSTASGGAVTFTSATPRQYCPDSSGALRSLAANKPCVVDGLSLKVRSAVQNFAWPSEDMTDTVRWVESNAAVTEAGNSASCPLNPLGARMDLVSNTSATNTDSIKFTATVGSTVGPFTGSVWVGSTAGSTTQTVFVQCGAGNATSCSCSGASCSAAASGSLCIGTVTATTTPDRVVVTTSCTLATTAPSLGLEPGQRSSSTGSGCFSLAQVVTASVPGDYCPTTTGAVTCSAETATVATPATLSRTEGSVCLNITPSWTGAPGATSAFLSGATGGSARFAYSTSTDAYRAFDGTSAPGVTAGWTAGVRKRYCTRWSALGNFLRVENISAGTSTSAAFTTFGAYDATLEVGLLNSGNQSNAAIDSVCMSRNPLGCN